MSKKVLLTSFVIFFSFQVKSQILISLLFGDKLNSDGIEFGLEGAYNSSIISGMESSTRLSGLNLGFYFDFRIKNSLHLYTGVMVKSRLGISNLKSSDLELLKANLYEGSGTYSQKLSYFMVPVLAKYKFKNFLYLEAGPQAGLLSKAYIEYIANEGNSEARIRQDNKGSFRALDFGFVGGLGYQLMKGKGVTIGVKYYYGLIDVSKISQETRNSSFFVKINIPIGAGKTSMTE